MTSVSIGTFNLSGTDANGVTCITEEVSGWGSTDSAASQKQRAQASGMWSTLLKQKGRALTVSGWLTGPSLSAVAASLDNLIAAVDPVATTFTVTDDNGTRSAPVHLATGVQETWVSATALQWTFQVVSDDWRKFGAALVGSTLLPSTSGGLAILPVVSHAWTGSSYASSSTESVAGVVQRTNLTTDPQARNLGTIPGGGTGWVGRWFGAGGGNGTGTLMSNQTDGPAGATSYARKTWTAIGSGVQDVAWSHTNGSTSAFPVTAGQMLSVSTYIRGSHTQPSQDGNNGMVIQWFDSSGNQIGNGVFGAASGAITAGAWIRYGVAAVAPANAAYAFFYTQVYLSTAAWSVGDTLDGTALLVESASSVGVYFDGSSAASGGLSVPTISHAWTAAPNASASTEIGPGVNRTNLVTNPGFEGGTTTGWSSNTGAPTLAASQTVSHSGTSSLCATSTASGGDVAVSTNVPANIPGQYTVSYWVYSVSGCTSYFDTETASRQGVVTVPPNVWTKVVATVTFAAGSRAVYLHNLQPSSAAGQVVYIDDVLIESGASAGTYFDGGSAPIGGLRIQATTVTGQVSLTNPGNETGPMQLRIDGPCTGPVITHVGTGAAIVFASSLVLHAGEWLLVDLESHQVTANGQVSRNGYVTSRGWFGFDPGVNTLAFTATAFDPNSRLTVTAVPAWR